MKFLTMLLISVGSVFAAVDLNTASEKELTSLHGIGNKKAKDILNYRKENCFKTINDLSNIKGIGKKTVAKNEADLIVSTCTNN